MDLTAAALIAIFLSLILYWIRQRRERLSIFEQNGIPGPEPSFWTGNFIEFSNKREEFVADSLQKHGKIFGFFLGMKPFLIVTDQELIKLIQVKEFGKFRDRDIILADFGIPQPEIMKSMPALRGEEWRKNRALISPLFNTKKLKRMMPIINEAGSIFMEKVKASSNEDCINLVTLVRNLNLDIMTKVALGIDTGVQHEARSKILDSTKLFLSTDISDVLPSISLCFPELEPIPTMLRNFKDSLQYLLGLPSVKNVITTVRGVMNNRRRNFQRQEDMLQALMESKTEMKRIMSVRDEELIVSSENKETDTSFENKHETPSDTVSHFYLTEDNIIGTAGILLVAGTDTATMNISRVAYYLSKEEEIQEKAREELNSVLGDKKNIDYDDLSKLSYLDQIMSEVLRLHPNGSLATTRITAESFHYNGTTIPKGVTVAIPPSYLHKNPEYWTDPEKFDPERFSPENKAKHSLSMYQPFGNGPRNCVGMRLGQVSIKYTLARLIRSYRIKYCGKVRVERAMFLDQVQELMVRLEPITP